ncbi:hypothetical protein BCR33DRAFT_433348 [Rhizoclosmatium globosum]|uniref:Uncharacterized protein n=1 Tax=Rhizoclosmatium globosum TaxID=329046 RepID=A0A1Y2BTS2_9FUNG|nr:hypothetical protein BCR33DRAFT_433348 [Rhizoclosmatium globosum]|eukprot:ORY38152.1 hypothetical protein BCR33DRAFT_433348 [Rhizoclosmatium globosum]
MDELLRSHFNDIFPGTSGPKTSYSERRSFWLRAFDLARFLLVTAFACFLSSDLNGRVCQLQGCANKARFKCHTCFAVSSELPCFFCEHDAILHEWNCLCHRVRNENNAPPPHGPQLAVMYGGERFVVVNKLGLESWFTFIH